MMGTMKTSEFLEHLARLEVGAQLAVVGRANTETRLGSYVKIRQGLSSATYFVGVNPMQGPTMFVEFTG